MYVNYLKRESNPNKKWNLVRMSFEHRTLPFLAPRSTEWLILILRLLKLYIIIIIVIIIIIITFLIHLFCYSFICLFIYSFIYLFIYLFINLFIYLFFMIFRQYVTSLSEHLEYNSWTLILDLR